METIVLEEWYKKVVYVYSIIASIISFFIIHWIIILMLETYGKNTNNNQESIPWTLNKTYQKYIFVVGGFPFSLFFLPKEQK
jgi:hypothetical protein